MKTLEIYKFSELPKTVQNEIIEKKRFSNFLEPEIECLYNDSKKTVEAFCNLFNVKTSYSSFLEPCLSHIDDNILTLKGLRLRTYLINNFWDGIYKGKYYSLWSKTEKSYKYHKNGYPVLKKRISKTIFKNECPLTGICCDYNILEPMTNFVNKFTEKDKETSFEDLVINCFYSLSLHLESGKDYYNSKEYIYEKMNEEEEENYTIEGYEV